MDPDPYPWGPYPHTQRVHCTRRPTLVWVKHGISFVIHTLITSPIYRTCFLNNCRVPCWCHSWQTPNLVFRVLSIPYTLALKAASIASHRSCQEQQGEEDDKDDKENSSCSRGEALAGAQDMIHLKPFGTFFFSFYYTNEISSLCPPLAPPQYITTRKGCWLPPAQKQLKWHFLLSFGGSRCVSSPR